MDGQHSVFVQIAWYCVEDVMMPMIAVSECTKRQKKKECNKNVYGVAKYLPSFRLDAFQHQVPYQSVLKGHVIYLPTSFFQALSFLSRTEHVLIECSMVNISRREKEKQPFTVYNVPTYLTLDDFKKR